MRVLQRIMLVAAVAGLGLLGGSAWAGNGRVVAGGGGHGNGPCKAFGEGASVVMRDSCFDGIAHRAGEGQTLEIVNEGALPHSFTAVDASFDTGILQPGERYELTIDQPGEFRVYCTLHGSRQGDGMAGLLLVGDTPAGGVQAVAGVQSTDSGFGGPALALVGAGALLLGLVAGRHPRTRHALERIGRARSER